MTIKVFSTKMIVDVVPVILGTLQQHFFFFFMPPTSSALTSFLANLKVSRILDGYKIIDK